MSTISSARISTPLESTATKEKEFMTNTRILAMSNMIESFKTTHSKQGFYGKQLKIIGSSSASGAELELTVKIHIIEDSWTTCPLLPPSTILHRWKVCPLGAAAIVDSDSGSEQSTSKEDKEGSWIKATAERIESLSPASSPKSEKRPRRPLSTSSASSFLARPATSKTHVAVLSNALSFVANKAGDYLVHLSIHLPFVVGTGSHSIHLSQIPKCRTNFIKFKVQSHDTGADAGEESSQENDSEANGHSDCFQDEVNNSNNNLEFNVHPSVLTIDEAHLNPECDEDAQFWLEVQEHLLGREEFVGRLVGDEKTGSLATSYDGPDDDSEADKIQSQSGTVIAGCFAPSSSLHISWMSRDVVGFVQDVRQDLIIRIKGLPDQTKSSSLLQDRRRKDPEESHIVDHNDPDEDPTEYEHLEMEDSDLVITVEDIVTVNVQKLGWKQPFMDFTIARSDTENGQVNDISLLEIAGEAVQYWERIDVRGRKIAPSACQDIANKEMSPMYRIWFFAGTEGETLVNISFRIGQAVSVGYGKDIGCLLPKICILDVSEDKGLIHVHTSNSIVVQRCNTRLLESAYIDDHSPLQDNSAARQQPELHFQYQSPDYQLSVIVQRYQALARIARIERIHAEIGVSARQQPGFARVILSNIVLPQQDDAYLRVYQLDGAEIWSVLVDGKPCSKSIQMKDRKSTAQRTVLIPIPQESQEESDNTHQVEISYGFNTVDHELEEELGDELLSSAIKLVVPGFNLPVGEYLVVASLPKLSKDMNYDEPTGDFEIVSSQGLPGQRRTITYGAYMTLGRPKLSLRTKRLESFPGLGQVQQASADQGSLEALEQITRTHGHGFGIVHDPQQPPFSPGPVIIQPASQRHPQQPSEPQNPQAEQVLDGEILPVLGTRTHIAQGVSQTPQHSSNLSPQVGSPTSLGSANARIFRDREAFSLESLTFLEVGRLVRLWWKQVMAPVVALALVIMIINVAAFQDTRTTSLDLVEVSVWRKPFVTIRQLWKSSNVAHKQHEHETRVRGHEQLEFEDMHGVAYSPVSDGPVGRVKDNEAFIPPETIVAYEALPTATLELEIRVPPSKANGGGGSSFETYEDRDGGGNARDQEAGGLQQWIRFLKAMVQKLQPS
ncbi:hypothetical protein BGX28_005841 [Mortierella sp. GBA30]|nr:hypothetical protein BGX28_005841 [Mortierella sp. GBA30]